MELADAFVQIDAALEIAEAALDASESGYRASGQYSEAITVCASTIDRLASESSVYLRQMRRILDRQGSTLPFHVEQLLGILKALRQDMDAGYLQTFREEVHADVFADFLEMAGHLVKEGYTLPAAVVAGSALEAHLRALAERAEVNTQARGRPKRAGALNDDLAKANVYSKAEQKQVLAWQDLRNAAAHGDAGFTAAEVRLMCQGIREFILRHPA